MTAPDPPHVTRLVNLASHGDAGAAEELLPLIYGELRRLAVSRMAFERPDHTLQATALVHEAWLELIELEDAEWASRGHFFKMASLAMRHLLVDHARRKNSVKAGGGALCLSLDENQSATAASPPELSPSPLGVLEVDDALQLLEEVDAELAQLVQLRFFGGLTMEQVAETLELPKRTVERRWAVARTWLQEKLGE